MTVQETACRPLLCRVFRRAVALLSIAPGAMALVGASTMNLVGGRPSPNEASPVADESGEVLVVDAVTLKPLAGVVVHGSSDDGDDVQITDADGVARFTALPVASPPHPEDVEALTNPPKYVMQASPEGYLPANRGFSLNAVARRGVLQLVPDDTGVVTPKIGATAGGRIQLPGLGALHVPPDALLQDAVLRVIPISRAARVSGLVDGDLVYEVWLSSEDEWGVPIPSLPTGFGGIQLTIPLPALPDVPENMTRSWRAHLFTADWSAADSLPVSVNDGSQRATIPVGGGKTLFRYEYETSVLDCKWGPWALEVTALSTRIPAGTSVSVNCGIYANDVSIKVSAGETVTTTYEVGAEVEGTVGWETGVLFAKASAELGVTLSGNASSSTAKTTMVEATKSTPSTGTINGEDQSTLTPPWSCVSGTAKYGIEIVTYALWAKRRCVHPDGTIEKQSVDLGTLDAPGRIGIEWDVEIDPDCGEGCDEAVMPDPLPV